MSPRFSGGDLTIDLPAGWEVRIAKAQDRAASTLLHAATFELPARRGDFGSGAVELMTPLDTFVTLFEFGPDSVGQPLFANQGLPRDLDPDAFHPAALQRVIPGQAGVQRFFTENGRAFCLYAVIGSWSERQRLVPRVSDLLAGVTVDPTS